MACGAQGREPIRSFRLRTMPPILEAKDVSKIYQMGSTSVAALDHVSLAVAEGEFAAIQGTSGSGKDRKSVV